MVYMKNIILSFVVITVVVIGGYYLFKGKDTSIANIVDVPSNDTYSTTTPVINATSTPVVVTTSTTSPKVIINKNNFHMITLETTYGKIVIQTYDADAPNTVSNFITLANKGFYNGLTFHRVIKGFMIQGGDPTGNGTGGPGYQFADELNPQTASYKAGYKTGVVAMANAGPNTNGSQFFIMAADYPLPNSYTIFGKVVSGQDVVNTIVNVPTGQNDKPLTPVVMSKVTVK